MKSVPPPDLTRLLEKSESTGYVLDLLDLPAGYYSAPELAHRVAGAEKIDRVVFYNLLNAMEANGYETIAAWHNGATLRIVPIDPTTLREFFAGLR